MCKYPKKDTSKGFRSYLFDLRRKSVLINVENFLYKTQNPCFGLQFKLYICNTSNY